ncbi:bifunctional YncE family protein/alkaline phosphatase family protein [Fulvivirgaceae bacterium BMA12]|uniref:Bifunctional YncE family protein/alkaline phosphatase family protein n=1 Tax=Agaribacillus aureus TaxID=3051825 RepID=A0ABT8LAM9_9BACT|nr:bifunctional YncE family protein/alkaline phosphatase family protein [Fulvivirgaceae bacterium BMA12]
MARLLCFLLVTVFCAACKTSTTSKEEQWIGFAPAGQQYCQINPGGQTILPNGRIIKPYGQTYTVAPHPYGLTLSPDGTVAITANSGTEPFSISILRNIHQTPVIQQIPEGAKNDEGILESVFMGLAITPDNRHVYVGGGASNKIFKFDIATGDKVDSIDCSVIDNRIDYTHGYIGDLLLNEAGTRLYAIDQIGFRVLVIDTGTRSILQNVPTGRYPFGICLAPDQKSLYVANVGMFEYQAFAHLDHDDLKKGALKFPASAYGSQEMIEGYKNDSIDVPGLGDPNDPAAFSVWKYDLADKVVVSRKIKTGILVGEKVEGIPAVGGSSPNSIVATDQYVFVSNGNNDCISVIDFHQDTLIQNIFIKPDPKIAHLRGVIPFGLALSPDQQRLYVAEAGINAVGVIDIPTLEVKGHIPVGWFPSKLAVTPDGKKIIVANAKGFGSGPNGGANYDEGPEGTYVGNLMKGTVTVLDVLPDEALAQSSAEVISNMVSFNRADDLPAERKNNPIPIYPKASDSPIRHIVFISKENRTYDEVFGQIKAGRGDPTLARYGVGQSFSNHAKTDSVKNADVMTNHLALARRFAIADNFYVDADHSADGHRWLVNTYPNEWVETHVAAAYGGKRGSRRDSKAPGNLGLVGASGAIYPEDYNEAGSIWDHFERNQIDFFNFGFGVEMAGTLSDSTLKNTGVTYLVNYPLPGPLYDRSSRNYATYNMAIPDQFRVDQFIAEFNEKWMGDGKELPQVITLILPNDHGAGDRPAAGYPFKESYMIDNDLALGRIVEFLTNTPYWKSMAIIVTEDDSQDGVDHIDAHRSLLMVISPWSRRNYVGHQHYSFGSIFKTFWHILGTPYLNQYDATASDLSDLFTNEPDFAPYMPIPADPRVFDPQKALDPFDENFDWKAVIESPKLDDVDDFLESHGEE